MDALISLPEIKDFPMARYRLDFTTINEICLPEYAGSTLRGAFGHALRHLACTTRAKACHGCILATTCPYPAVFEPQKPKYGTLELATPPVPYIIEPPPWGERKYFRGEVLSFHFTLIGHAIDHLNIVIMAWQRALARGIGAGQGTAHLKTIYYCTRQNETLIHSSGENILPHSPKQILPYEPLTKKVILEFITPLRLQENGNALPPSRINAKPLLTALVRRASLLAEYYGGGPLYEAEQFAALAQVAACINADTSLRWYDWTRRSTRQGRTMQLGGCIGSITLSGEIIPFSSVLYIGEWLHVGKEASFGLGQYRLHSYP